MDDAKADNEKFIRCHAVSLCDAGARAQSAVKFDGISETHWQNESTPVAYTGAYTGVYYSTRLCNTKEMLAIHYVFHFIHYGYSTNVRNFK
jgi:hypothetical protein